MAAFEFHRFKLEQARDRWKRLNELALALQAQFDVETRAEEKARLKPLIEEKQEARSAVEREIQSLQREIEAAPKPPCLFYSYAHEDELLRDELAKHLKLLERQETISSWHDRDIGAGADWNREISRHLLDAEIILLLVSANFLASDYIWSQELRIALERHDQGETHVVPIILRPCDWTNSPFARLQALPRDGKPVTSFRSRDEAFASIAQALRALALSLRA